MIFPWPTAGEERIAALQMNAESWREDGLLTADEAAAIAALPDGGWRRNRLLLTIAFFLLALLGFGAVCSLLFLFGVRSSFFAGVIAIAGAEWLIRRFRLARTGVESALWLAGPLCLVFALPSSGKPEALLVVAAALALSTWRVRNPLFAAVAAVLVVAYTAVKWEAPWPPVATGLGIALCAAVLLLRRTIRPSTEWILAAVLLVSPAAAYVAAVIPHRAPVALAFLAAGAVLMWIGIRTRHRALLIASAVSLGLAAFDVVQRLAYPVEARLIASGVALVAIAATASRLLRERTRGFVVTKSGVTRFDEAMQIAGTLTIHQAVRPAEDTGLQPGGGSFGGAGASGDY